ncbi:hypothetical protein GCM10027615_21770 [Plantactinospora veratri]
MGGQDFSVGIGTGAPSSWRIVSRSYAHRMWLNILLALGSGIAGAIATPYLTQARERRAARAAVRGALHESRSAWRPTSTDAFYEGHPNHKLDEAISKVESLAIIANVPRGLMARYESAHRAAYREAIEQADGWTTAPQCLTELRAATEALTGYLWHPARYHLGGRLSFRRRGGVLP